MRKIAVAALAILAAGLGPLACKHPQPPEKQHHAAPPPAPPGPRGRKPAAPLADGQAYRYRGDVVEQISLEQAAAARQLVVNLGDAWAPFIFQDSSGPDDPPKPNAYRDTFIALANEKVDADGLAPRPGEHNYLEVFGIPPTLSVLLARIDEDSPPDRRACYDGVDYEGLRAFTGNIIYLDRDRSRREHQEALSDEAWVDKQVAERSQGGDAARPREQVLEELRADPKTRGRADRFLRGQARLRAVRAAQARLLCEGLLSASGRVRFGDGVYDLFTHEALAQWERKNDIFGWGFLGGETAAALQRPPLELHFDTFKRILAERVADAAGIVEDGSIARRKRPPTYRDEAGVSHPVPNLIDDFVKALLASLDIETPEDMVAFLRSHGAQGLASLRVAFDPPPLPPYYGPRMQLSVDIDRGDVWYDLPFDGRGREIVQRRDHYPHLTLSVHWNGQKIPLVWWRTTIGSWRSELHADGQVYLKYKNSDVGRRVWRHIVAAPVWIPPDGTPAKDLLTRKVLDRSVGPVTVVNTDVMGPGFQSAYGLVMAIHVDGRRGGWDNQIRTHGSVDYTSIARRFSHGCHRLVNNRAVRLFDFVLRHRGFKRQGQSAIRVKRRFEVDGEAYRYQLDTRGYYYELDEPIVVEVHEGRVMGAVKHPITAYVRKPGVEYAPAPSDSDGDAAASIATPQLTGTEAQGAGGGVTPIGP